MYPKQVRYQAAPLTDRDIFKDKLLIKLENMVRKERLELSRREALEPKSSVSTNSTTSAKKWGGRWDLNPRQPESQSGALPTELHPPLSDFLWRVLAHPAGFEPATDGLEGRCSIQLSYGRTSNLTLPSREWSARLDSNQRPLGPKPSALPNCATRRTL